MLSGDLHRYLETLVPPRLTVRKTSSKRFHMKRAKSQDKAIAAYGYARDLFANPAARQEKALLDSGCSGVFVEGRGRESLALLAQKARGAVIRIATAAVLPNGADGIRAALANLDHYHAVLVVDDTGKRSDSGMQRAEIILDALEGQRRNKHEWNSSTAKRAGKRSWKSRKKEQAPVTEALRLWRDTANYPRGVDVDAALRKIGWTARSMHAKFPGGRYPEIGFGRPRKTKT